ncbi:MAG: hypothetical protein J7499_07105 [Sphingopyxis sp.]|nr:hypothetical protein [Sphingopyxis sp.]
MDNMDEKIRRHALSLNDARLAEHEARWMEAFAAAGTRRAPTGFARSGTAVLAMAIGIGFVGAQPERWLPGASPEPADDAILTAFSIEAPLAPSTLLAE